MVNVPRTWRQPERKKIRGRRRGELRGWYRRLRVRVERTTKWCCVGQDDQGGCACCSHEIAATGMESASLDRIEPTPTWCHLFPQRSIKLSAFHGASKRSTSQLSVSQNPLPTKRNAIR